jgi:Tol biopolymer transport system component
MASTGKDLYYSSRPTVDSPWSDAVALPFNSPTTSDETPRLSADDKALYFASGRAGNGTLDIYEITRAAAGSTTTWGTLGPVSLVNTTALSEKWFSPCGGNRYAMVQNATGAQPDLVEGAVGGPAAKPIDELNSTGNDTGAFLTADCLTIYFASGRSGDTRLYRSQRASLTAAWSSPPALVRDFDSIGGDQEDPWLSPDGKTFAFVSDASGSKDVYLSTRGAVIGAR